MLIRRGKAEGWLHLDTKSLKTWAEASGITFTNASPTAVPGRGTGLLADRDLKTESSLPTEILTIDEELVLSGEAVRRHAQFDKDFREVLESLGDFGRSNLMGHATPRGAILSFLLFQASLSCPHLEERVGVHCAFTDYVKSLPSELLPTFWTPDELQLLIGTTLAPAISSKLKSLRREYDLFCEAASNTRWYNIVSPHFSFDDWLQVDAMFRSRALDFYGSCMIPGMDLASHAAHERTNAFYDRGYGKYHLYLMKGKELKVGEEVCITYGDEKGACEMLFSYGFLDEHMDTAETLFLSLNIPDDDISRSAKMKIANCAPGFKLIDISSSFSPNINDPESSTQDANEDDPSSSGTIDWTGDFIYLLCVTPSDGLEFQLAQTIDTTSEPELQATFNGTELPEGAISLRRLLAASDKWDVYRLRAIVILQQRVFEQMQVLYSSQEDMESVPHGEGTDVRDVCYEQAMKLRRLEFELLEKAYEDFEKQKIELAETPAVKKFLAEMNGNVGAEEDAAIGSSEPVPVDEFA
ncbi:hypothetical protein CKM354_000371800 [Cercospora kikuchii]|uniref:SET domain-containing protein n=1 Tax=Cercospora kikuchii TaxID=84275 RepID=A0A9P3CKY4_9PEZI|nr:uncharacterized protein CKM354_000371800 [Cercospora kikuchii]GIZ40378.1 hypothetical protein CKM354_000371800 [Cercospora kikuchii]